MKRLGVVLALLFALLFLAGTTQAISISSFSGQGFTVIDNYTTLHFTDTGYAYVEVNGTEKVELDFMLDYSNDDKQSFAIAFFVNNTFISVEYSDDHGENNAEWLIATGRTKYFSSDIHDSVDVVTHIHVDERDYQDGKFHHVEISFADSNKTFVRVIVDGTELINTPVNFEYRNVNKIVIRNIGFSKDFTDWYGGWWADLYVKNVVIVQGKAEVSFSLKDALTGQPLTGVTVKEGDMVLGTIDDGGSLELAKGTHTLTFSKEGYWSVTKTIDVQSDMSVSVEMYPSSAAFKLENFPADISIPENTLYTLTFTLSPIQTSATYNTYLSLSGLDNVISVEKDGSVISPEGGKYYLGDISGPTQISIKFKAGAVGQHGFTITLTSNDAIMSKTYTTTKQVVYKVEPLPFSVQMPSEWQVGENQLRISESSGQSYLITAVLKDSGGNEVWSDSHSFNPYEAYTFSINVPSEGSYTLELQFNGQTAVYSITVNPAITLKTKTLTVQKGGEGTIVLHFKNPSSNVQYYTIKVSGGFLPKEINQSISVAPLAEKDVSIAFAVPEELTYDAYELNVAVMQGNATVFSDKVVVSISDDSGFSLFGGGSGGGKTLLYILAGLLLVGGLVWALRRKRRR
uniref:T26-5p n=1 Tax=Thermococcus sp. 26/2 TaxID=758583 RepID=D6MY28_9EURY|nr:t26-5p [Thermococcus sp. 26/2]